MPETRFTEDHLWVRLDDRVATVGITSFALEVLGAVALVQAPAPGRHVLAGEACTVIETVKAASDAPAPLSGTVLETNPGVDDPALINRDSEGSGWLYRMRPDTPAAFHRLMDAAAYGAFLKAL